MTFRHSQYSTAFTAPLGNLRVDYQNLVFGHLLIFYLIFCLVNCETHFKIAVFALKLNKREVLE